MNAQHWAKQKERGTAFFLNLTRLIVQYCPLWLIRLCTFVVVCYFFLTARAARQNLRRYYQRLQQSQPQAQLPRFALLRHFLAFGEAITDRFAVWQRKIQYADLNLDVDEVYQQVCSEGRGQLMICSHFGNIEMCRALVNADPHRNFKLNILVHSRHAQAFNETLEKAGATQLPLIQVSELDAPKMLELYQRLERGEWIAIAADRVPVRGDKTLSADFLGSPAQFPQGPWLLAALLKAPMNTIFCIKENGRYRLKLRRFSDPISGRGAQRSAQIQQCIQHYADVLGEECGQNPLQWFNFYDFWEDYKK